jgi:hypothetical protein
VKDGALTALRYTSGNYIFAKEVTPGHWLPVYVGQTSNLGERFDSHHKIATAKRLGAMAASMKAWAA